MANIIHLLMIFFLLLILTCHHVIQGAAKSSRTSFIGPSRRESHLQGGGGGGKRWVDKNPRRLGLSPNLNGGDKPQEVSQRFKNSHLSLPWSLKRGGKLRDGSQRSTGSLENPRILELNNPNSKTSHMFLPQRHIGSLESPKRLELNNQNSHLSLPWSLNRGEKLRDLSLENPRRLGLDPNPKKNSHLSLPWSSLDRGSNSRDVAHRFTDSPKNPPRRIMIGSVAPTCTYNECKGCKYKCRAEQVPVEGNDPINSPYHYKCVCHR